ncbi:MAG: NAD-dependent epimerase/dehydratase family protein [Rhodoplanes sp.]|uniref:NAD-dependent epimerase/dehydratase family protein n=1 Tax=Rhodoplanes sp. TaxID=1968906 RepID=UPI0018097FCB|nr:NAD-dependent epimerase/dehydratase family protein [Rhodoplanes sp.]NVO17987.1 NAD-dependent epimerase/dehydratase family protein [Rhodoplanes sp.]
MKILITGASGFVGRALVPAALAAGHRVRAAARSPAALAIDPAVEAVRLPDLAGPVDWAPLIECVDAVVHLAGIAHRSGVDDAGYDRVIRAATGDLAHACARPGTPLVFVSSIGAQTGSAADGVLTEADPPRPATPYDRAKLAAEAEVRAAGGPFTILRPTLVYGPGVKANMAALMRLAASPWPLPFGAFANRRSLLALDNLIGAILFCLAAPATRGETYVVADPEPITVADMVGALREAAGSRAPLLPVPPVVFETVLRIAGRFALWDRIGRELMVDPGKLRAAGWRPLVDTPAGLAAMARANRAANRR